MAESEMVERCARAMWAASGGASPWDDALDEDYYDGFGRNTLRKIARAAIEVMREPTHGMVGGTVDNVFDGAIEDANLIPQIYRAMIDEALK